MLVGTIVKLRVVKTPFCSEFLDIKIFLGLAGYAIYIDGPPFNKLKFTFTPFILFYEY